MMTFLEFQEKWNMMPIRERGFILVDSTHPIEINIGYEELNQKTLLIMNSGEINEITSSRSILVKNYLFSDNNWVLSFTLIKNDNEDVFLRFCWDIIESSREAQNCLIKSILERYLKWLRLLEHKRPDILDLSRQKGLIGELLFLEELIKTFDLSKAINSWSGPDGADQDFIYDKTWVEVKAISLSSDSVHVSSLEQLDVTFEGTLLVYLIESTTIENANGFSLLEKVESIRRYFETNLQLKERFELKLFQSDYVDSKEYDKQKFRYCKKNEYTVNDKFPTLKKSNVDHAIISAKYSISLAAIEKFKK